VGKFKVMTGLNAGDAISGDSFEYVNDLKSDRITQKTYWRGVEEFELETFQTDCERYNFCRPVRNRV